MARYIDADKFTERIKASPAFRNIYDGLLLQRVVIDLLNNIPTVDVVPKSEVEKLKADLIVWKQNRFNIYQRLELYEITRQKVAREIFEDVKTCMKNFEDDDDGYLLKKCEFEFFMRELEKIYTEDKE